MHRYDNVQQHIASHAACSCHRQSQRPIFDRSNSIPTSTSGPNQRPILMEIIPSGADKVRDRVSLKGTAVGVDALLNLIFGCRILDPQLCLGRAEQIRTVKADDASGQQWDENTVTASVVPPELAIDLNIPE